MSASAKSLRIERIRFGVAKAYLDRHHPLGVGDPAFSFALGVSLGGKLLGVMTVGKPITNNAGAFLGLKQHELFELRKMHLLDACPRNSESRALAILAMLVRKHYPGVKAIVTYCDDGAKAAAYKGAGWKACRSIRRPRRLLVGGKWYSVRDANRKGIAGLATEKRYETRRKWALPLAPDVEVLFNRSVAGLM